MQNYFIKSGYKVNLNDDNTVVEQYTDIPQDTTYQVPCYKYAAELIQKNKIKSVLELGSGSGRKLIKYIYPYCKDIVGVDMPHSVKYCEKHFPFAKWVFDDFDHPYAELERKFEMTISFDVIEHLVQPEKLLNKIKQYSTHNTIVLISTPERDSFVGVEDFGPPKNKLHVREWNREELAKFIKSQGFEIIDHKQLIPKKYNLREFLGHVRRAFNTKSCQLISCRYLGK